MGKKYTKKEKVLVLRHDVILGSTYELQEVEVDVTDLVGGKENMMYDASVVIPITSEDLQESIVKYYDTNHMLSLKTTEVEKGNQKNVVVKNKRTED